jgi:SAM-dependent methyltransferase
MSLRVDAQRCYLSDEVRTFAYRCAIQEVVKPGDVVLDLGCGTGIFGFYACQAGAKRVYAIDDNGLIELAARFARDNGFADRITFIGGLSTTLELPERVDVAIAEQLGRLGPEAGIFRFFADAHRRLLKPGGRLIPSRIDIWTGPVEYPEGRREISFWEKNPAGYDFTAAARMARSLPLSAGFQTRDILAAPRLIASAALAADEAKPFGGETTLAAERAGLLDGLCGWFEAQLAPNVRLTNSTLAPVRMERPNVFLPLERPVAVDPGDIIAIKLRIVPEQCLAAWQVTVTGRTGNLKTRTQTSSLGGLLLPRDEVGKIHPTSMPVLDGRHDAYRTTLNLCDGVRSIADIATELCQRHPDLFGTQRAAEDFVGAVIVRQHYGLYF